MPWGERWWGRAPNGAKPRIVLRDAMNNVLEVVELADFLVICDSPLSVGLTWGELVAWCSETAPTGGGEPERTLHAPAAGVVGSPAE